MPFQRSTVALVLLALLTFAAYWNAWPDALVLDDQVFAGQARFADLSRIPDYFRQTVWGPLGDRDDKLYRPLLLASFAIDSALLPDRPDLWHLVNVLLHLIATLLVYVFLLQLLRLADPHSELPVLVALVAAAVFGVHPVHTEVVNSIFNRSVLFVAIGWLTGLYWLLRYVGSRPLLAWSGIWLVYWFVLFSRETGIVLPALAVVLVWVFSSGGWRTRAWRCLPALSMAVPLVVYLYLRARAIELAIPPEAETAGDLLGMGNLFASQDLSQWRSVLRLAGVWLEALRLAVWPLPLLVDHPAPSAGVQIAGLFVHAALIAAALYCYRRNRVGLIAGLAIFYIALIPSSRLFGLGSGLPVVAERFLYEPSIGLAVLLAFGLNYLNRRGDRLLVLGPALLAVGLLTPLTWARNADWSDSIRLLEHDYGHGARSSTALNALTARLVEKGDYRRALDVCRENENSRYVTGMLQLNCGTTYLLSGDFQRAELALLDAAEDAGIRSRAHSNLSHLYLTQGRYDEALIQLELSVESEQNPARRAYRRGLMLAQLHPGDRSQLLEARRNLEEALRLRPGYAEAQEALDKVNRSLRELP